MRVAEEREREKISEDTEAENFITLVNITNPHVQGAHQISSIRNIKKKNYNT